MRPSSLCYRRALFSLLCLSLASPLPWGFTLIVALHHLTLNTILSLAVLFVPTNETIPFQLLTSFYPRIFKGYPDNALGRPPPSGYPRLDLGQVTVFLLTYLIVAFRFHLSIPPSFVDPLNFHLSCVLPPGSPPPFMAFECAICRTLFGVLVWFWFP